MEVIDDVHPPQGGSRSRSRSRSKSNSLPRSRLRIVEFFAGMGGMRSAADVSGLSFEVVAAYEISEICAKAYQHNFGSDEWFVKTIDSLSAEDLDKLEADVWLMSPPCQPFTRSGRQKDTEDNRTMALLNLVKVLGEMKRRPRFLLLENVIGFEQSGSRSQLISALAGLGWVCAEFALHPEDFGLPNRRPRYYGLFREHHPQSEVADRWCKWTPAKELADAQSGNKGAAPALQGVPWKASLPAPLGDFLQSPADLEAEEKLLGESLEIPQKVMEKRLERDSRCDVHIRSDHSSGCFTKVNGRLPRGHSPLVVIDEAETGPLEERQRVSADGRDPIIDHVWQPGVRLRYISPVEQLRLMGYPAAYSFPPDLTFKDIASLVGNSLNVKVVAWLLRVLLGGEGLIEAPEMLGERRH